MLKKKAGFLGVLRKLLNIILFKNIILREKSLIS